MKTLTLKALIVFLMNLMLSLPVNAVNGKNPVSDPKTKKDPDALNIIESNKKTSLRILCTPMDKSGTILNGVEIALLKNNAIIEKKKINDAQEVKDVVFNNVSKNSSYSVRISKEGYFSRQINVSTEILDMKRWKEVFVYEFELELSKTDHTCDDITWIIR